MINFHHFAPKLGLVAILTIGLLPTGACAGAQTRAEAAIAEAKGKIDAGDKVGAGDQAAELQGQARRALMSAEDLLSQHRKGEALAAAHHAGELADEALTRTTNRRNAAERDRRVDLRGGGRCRAAKRRRGQYQGGFGPAGNHHGEYARRFRRAIERGRQCPGLVPAQCAAPRGARGDNNHCRQHQPQLMPEGALSRSPEHWRGRGIVQSGAPPPARCAPQGHCVASMKGPFMRRLILAGVAALALGGAGQPLFAQTADMGQPAPIQLQANPTGPGTPSATPPNPATANSPVPPAMPADPNYHAGPYVGALTPPPPEAMNKTYPVCTRKLRDNCTNPGHR